MDLKKLIEILIETKFLEQYKIGIVGKYYDGDIYINEDFDEDTHEYRQNRNKRNELKIENLTKFSLNIANRYNDKFGEYYDDMCRDHLENFLVLSSNNGNFLLEINIERISGPITEGYQYYEYGDGNEPIEDFAYGVVDKRWNIFSIPVDSDENKIKEILTEVLANNDYYFNSDFENERKEKLLVKEQIKQKEKEEKIKAKKMAEYLKLQKELGLIKLI
jgi:hypothetical protein